MAVTAKFQADFESFYAAVSKADAKLNDFDKGVGKINSTLQRMTSAFDGTQIIKEATLVNEAVMRIGGATKLTEAEQERVNRTITAALDKYKALGIEAPASLRMMADETKKVEAATVPASKTMQGFLDHFKGTLAGMVSAAAIIGGVKAAFQGLAAFVTTSVKAYAEAEAAQKKLTTALENSGNTTPGVIGKFNALSKQFQQTTVYSDDLVTEMQALLVEVGNVMPAQMEGALTAATNLASGLGIDLRQATMLVGKAFAGETGTLKRYGIVIDEAKLAAEGMPAVLDAIQQRFGGQAAAEVETYAGKVKQLENAWNDLQEIVGKSIVEDPLVRASIKGLGDEIIGASNAADEARGTFTSWLAGLVSGSPALERGIEIVSEYEGELQAVLSTLRELTKIKPPASLTYGDAPVGLMEDERQALEKLWREQAEAEKAAKKYGEAVQALRNQLSGAALQGEVKKLHDAFRGLTPEQLRNVETTNRVSEAARKLHADGARLTPELFALLARTQQLTPAVQDLGSEFLNTLGPGLKMAYDLGVKLPTVIHGINGAVSAGNVIAMQIPEHLVKGWKESEELAKRNQKAVDELARSLGTLAQVSGGAFGDIVRDLSTMVAALDSANKSVDNLNDGMKSFKKDGFSFEALASTASGVIGLVSSLIAGFKALHSLFDRNKGRDVVKEFAGSFGGFDALHVKLLTLGDAGEQLWIKLTQGVGRNNPEQARAVIDEINAAFARQGEAATAAAQDTQKAQDQITAALQGSIDKINSELESLTRSVADEAPEKVMGHLERRARARIAQLEEERKKVQAEMDEASRQAEEAAANAGEGVAGLGNRLKDNARDWKSWADDAVREAERVQREVDAISFGHSPGGLKEIPLKLNEALRASARFSGRFSSDMDRAARVSDLGLRSGSGHGAAASEAGEATFVIHNYTVLDGNVVARDVARRLPKVVRAYL